MHDAYSAVLLVEKLPRQIEALACYSDNLLVGTKEGHLLVYSVHRNDSRFETCIERSNRLFSKKPITQLEVIPEYHILVSLSDGIVSVHDLTVFALITSIEKSRGTSLFALDLQKHISENADIQYSLRICVVVKRRLQLYYWKNRDFHELLPELVTPDVTKALAWCNTSLCVGFRREYFLIKIETGLLKELFSTGHQMEPLITKLSDNCLALTRDEATIFIDSEGNPMQKVALSWSAIPMTMVYSAPYIVAVLPNALEVRTIEPRLLIQTTEINKPKLICCGSQDQIYLGSQNSLWRLLGMPVALQIKQLMMKKEFELALRLAELMDESMLEKERQILEIRNLHAFDLFIQHRFAESMKHFLLLETDPSHVVGLFPHLLPADYRSQLEYPDHVPDLESSELERGLTCLIEYLIQKRNEIMKDPSKEFLTTPIVEGAPVMRSRKQIGQIIDTTLLKCYIQMNDALVAPLLRLKDNMCHLEEAERILKQHQKFSELIILYEKNKQHKRALDLLLRQSQKPNSILSGFEPTLQYLQCLGAANLQLIFEYAAWVIKASPEDGLRIFTEDTEEVKTLPRLDVLQYLEATDMMLSVPYLEHVINEWSDSMPELHNILAVKYVEMATKRFGEKAVLSEKEEDGSVTSAELRQVRHSLIEFLETSQSYEADRVLAHFPSDSLLEERAILLGKIGDHRKALAIYVHVLHDYEAAEKYCETAYQKAANADSTQVFLYLLKLYLSEPDHRWLGLTVAPSSVATFPDLNAAVNLLSRHSSHFDIIKALDALPTMIRISDILKFVEDSLMKSSAQKLNSHIMRRLLYSENLRVSEHYLVSRFTRCLITDQSTCCVCKKRIGNSAFARYPNNVVVHYYCCKDMFNCPGDGDYSKTM